MRREHRSRWTQPDTAISDQKRRGDLLTAVALIEFSVHYEDANPELSRRAWQLAAARFVIHDIKPKETVDALEVGTNTDHYTTNLF